MQKAEDPTVPEAHKAGKVQKHLVGNVFTVDVHTLPLARQEVCRVDGTGTGAIHRIETVPAAHGQGTALRTTFWVVNLSETWFQGAKRPHTSPSSEQQVAMLCFDRRCFALIGRREQINMREWTV